MGRSSNQITSKIEQTIQRALEILGQGGLALGQEEDPGTSADELLDLIHEINPTGRRLSPEAAERRYALKTRLQSYLLRHFPDEILVRPLRHSRSSVISLEHRHTARNACHAVLGNLDEDVRQWAAEQLGPARPGSRPPSGSPPERHAEARSGHGAPAGPLERGWAALEVYDYEAAREGFTEALAASAGGGRDHTEAALALLRLFVDHLAADEEALALLPGLSPAAAGHAEVRLLLGIAAARSGQEDVARRMVEGIAMPPGTVRPRVAVVYLLLCRAALARQEIAEAEALLEGARGCDPAHPEITELLDLLARARADERQPLEEEIAALCARGDHEAAEARARALLQRWPESEVARRTVRMIGEQRRQGEAQRLAAQAEEAITRGQRGAALTLLHQALGTGVHGPLHDRLQARLRRLEEEEHAHKLAERLATCTALLERGHLADGLEAYLGLEPRLREQVQERVPLPHYALLAEIAGPGGRAAPRAVAEAACALLAAQQAAEEDPETALALLAEHARLLEPVPLRRRVEHRAHEQVLRQWQERVHDHLGATFAALADGDVQRAQALLGELDLRALPPAAEAEAEELKRAIDLVLERRQLAQRFVALWKEGHLFAARGVVDAILSRHPGFGADFWRAQRARVDAAIQRAFAVRVEDGPGPENEFCDLDTTTCASAHGRTGRLLVPGQPLWVDAVTEDEWVFLRVAELGPGRVRTRARLRLPEPMTLQEVVADADSVWLLGRTGAVLQLGLPGFTVRRWYAGHEIAQSAEGGAAPVLEDAALAPGAGYLWLLSAGTPHRARVVDIGHQHLSREVGERRWLVPVPGGGEIAVICGRKEHSLTLHDSRGALVLRSGLATAVFADAAAAHPDGRGVLIFFFPKPDAGWGCDEDGKPSLYCAMNWPDRYSRRSTALPGTAGASRLAAALSRPQDAVFLRLRRADGEDELRTLRPQPDDGVSFDAPAPLPRDSVLLQDEDGQRAAVLAMTPEGIEVVELRADQPPALRGHDVPPEAAMAGLWALDACARLRELSERQRAIYQLLRPLRGAERMQAVQAQVQGNPENVEALVDLLHVLDYAHDRAQADPLAQRIWERDPRQPVAALLWATARARVRDARGVLKALAKLRRADFTPRQARHFYHLRGLAYLWQDRHELALKAFQRGQRCSARDGCNLTSFVALLTPVPEQVGLADLDPGLPPVRQLVLATRVADAALARGEWRVAWAAMDRRVVWREREVQSLARLAAAALEDCGASDFRKALALARYRALLRHDRGRELPLPTHRFSAAALDGLYAKAGEWLERHDVDPTGSTSARESEGEAAVAEEAHAAQGHVEE